jgi:erythromycin esterase
MQPTNRTRHGFPRVSRSRPSTTLRHGELVAEAQDLALPLDDPDDLDPLMARIGDARFVLVGEASHGTREYYEWRAALTRRLVQERGFTIVAVEGDWPDCARINRWVLGDADGTAADVLHRFERWPTWMWANREVEAFLTWLHEHNSQRSRSERVRFHGLDVYSLWESLRAIIDYLDVHDGEAALSARRAWSCLEPYDQDPQQYALATQVVPSSCEAEVVDLLQRLRRDAARGGDDPDARFDAEQNAAAAAGAERYYRAMVRGGPASWNIRDHHMADTLDRLVAHHGPDAKVVVWEHNTHVGDARATDMAAAAMVNVGQLVRERHHDEGVVLVGAGSDRGRVIAATAWGTPHEAVVVPAAREGSHEAIMHRTGRDRALFVFPDRHSTWLETWLGHRAIGVVYRPEREHMGNYVPTVLGSRYDAFWFFDETRALRPLRTATAPDHELETWPYGA